MGEVIRVIRSAALATFVVLLPSITPAQDTIASLRLTQSCTNCDFSNQNFPFSSFNGYQFRCTSFENSNLEEANFSGAKFHGSFNGANLRGASFSRATINVNGVMGCSREMDVIGRKSFAEGHGDPGFGFVSADLRGADLSNLTFEYPTPLRGARLDAANFSGVVARGATLDFSGASARRTNFREFNGSIKAFSAVFARADFSESFALWIEADSTDFSNAIFDGSDMTATMTNSNLVGASFIGANLTGADFSGSNLEDVDFTNANLSNAQLAGATLCNTTTPDGSVLFSGCPD